MVQLRGKQILTTWDACDRVIQKHCGKGFFFFFFLTSECRGNVMLEKAVTSQCSVQRWELCPAVANCQDLLYWSYFV